jgi:hypothetical protein
LAYITNKDEAETLENTDWQDQMAKAIADGILAYRVKIEEMVETPEPTEIEIKLNSSK